MSSPEKPPARASAYARAGVDLDRDDNFIERIKEIAKSTHRPELLAGISGFADLFKTPERYKDLVLGRRRALRLQPSPRQPPLYRAACAELP